MILKKLLTLILTLATTICYAQQPEKTIRFNTKGELIGTLPEKISKGENIIFKVTDGDDPIEEAAATLKKKAEKAKERLEKLVKDKAKMDLLKKVYDIGPADLTRLKDDYELVIRKIDDPNIQYMPLLKVDFEPYRLAIADLPGTEMKFDGVGLTKALTLKYTDDRSVSLKLRVLDPYKYATFKFYNDQQISFSETFNRDYINQINIRVNEVDSLLKKINAWLESISLESSSTVAEINAYGKKANAFLNEVESLNVKLRQELILDKNKEWIMKWYWYYNDEMPRINPFDFRSSGDIKSPDTSKAPALRLRLRSRENLIKNADYKKVSSETLDKYINEVDSFNIKLAVMMNASQKFKNDSSQNAKRINDFAGYTSNLNNVLFYLSDDSSGLTYLMRHHNARDGDLMMNSTVRSEYTEDDHVILLTHNLFTNEKVATEFSYVSIDKMESQFAEMINPKIGLLKDIFDPAKINTVWQDTTTSAMQVLIEKANKEIQAKNKARKDLRIALSKLKSATLVTKDYLTAANYICRQQVPMLSLEEIKSEGYTYHTQNEEPFQRRKNENVSYPVGDARITTTKSAQAGKADAEVKAPEKTENAVEYRVNKLYRVFPMAGVGFTLQDFYNSDGAGGNTISSEKRAHFFAGLKVFLRKTDIRNTSFFTEKDQQNRSLLLSRLSVTAAVDLGSPLDNIYTGAGLDLWPGLCLNAGMVLNRYTYYENSLGGGNISRNLYRPGIYVGISTDVNVVVQLVKLLNL